MAATVLMLLGAAAFGVGSYLYNDGYEGHDLAGRAGQLLGWASFFASTIAADQERANHRVDCDLHGRYCPDLSGAGVVHAVLNWFGDLFTEHLVELLLILAFGLVGAFAARLTRRRRGDGREWQVPPSVE